MSAWAVGFALGMTADDVLHSMSAGEIVEGASAWQRLRPGL